MNPDIHLLRTGGELTKTAPAAARFRIVVVACEFPVSVTPLAVFFIEFHIRFFTDRRIIQRHTTASANKLSWRT